MSRREHDCPKGRHEPGRTCYKVCGCRCYGCASDNADYERNRQRQIAYGRWRPYVDAEPARRHVRSLMASEVGATDGIGWKRIARLAGVSESMVWKLIYGDPQRGQAPSKRIRPGNAEALLAVHEGQLADGATVPAWPTWRKIDRMLDGGFAKAEIARLIAGDPDRNALQLSRDRITAGNARAVAKLYADWKVGRLRPMGPASRHFHDGALAMPWEPPPGTFCEDCGAKPYAGGRWCLDCFDVRTGRAS